jgi:S-formylglutathione hydrolase FrmB
MNVDTLLDASVVVGKLPLAISVGGGLALAVLLLRRERRWFTRAVPVAIAAAVGAAALAALVVDVVWRPFPDTLPLRVLIWIGVACLGMGLAAGQAAWSRSWRRLLPLVALAIALALPVMKINAFYSYYPTLRDALGMPAADAVDLADIARPDAIVATDTAVPLARRWSAPADMPKAGRVAQVDIPGTVSGFTARPASVYLPPAYLSALARPLLPVLVMIAGQPGGPQDWLTAGNLAHVMDGFAAAHAGLAPIVVVPDATGAPLADPMCLDSRLGNVETYLAKDVPAWVRGALQVDQDPAQWAIGGFSYGGTCALQLAVRAPDVYPTFLDISGQREPSLGDRASSVAAAFDGDEARFDAVNPLDVLATHTFPTSSGLIVTGADDTEYGSDASVVSAATRAAGMDTHLLAVRGGHTWAVAVSGLIAALPWLAGRTGLTDKAPAPGAASPVR